MKEVTAAIITNDDKILIAQRGKDENLAGKWEFPGGKIEKGETPQQCLKREIQEELELNIEVGEFFGESIYTYSNGQIKYLENHEKQENRMLVIYYDEIQMIEKL